MLSNPRIDFKALLMFISCLLIPIISYLQTVTKDPIILRDIRSLVETKYGQDDLLVNGILYHPKNVGAKGSPFFISDGEWKFSNLYIKGKTFFNQSVLYNINTDEIITNVTYSNGVSKSIILDQEFVDSLLIENHFFINISPYTNGEYSGFYDQVYSGHFKALIKYHITYEARISYNTPNGYYGKSQRALYILLNQKLIKVNSKKDLFIIFNSKKKEVIRYLRNNKINLRTANIQELFNFFRYCDDLSCL